MSSSVQARARQWLVAGLVLAVTLAAPPRATLQAARPVQDQSGARPLPDVKVVAAEVRRRLMSDRELQSQYTFLERREEIEISKLGRVSRGPAKTYEVYPSVEPGNTYKRLVAVDGKPVSAADLDRQDRKHRDDVLREMAKRERQTPAERAKRERQQAKERAERDAVVDEIFTLYDIRLVGRDRLDGHEALVATLDPRPGYKPRTDAGGLMKKIRARVWVSEADYQLMKVDAEVISDVTYGWGLAARLYKGSKAMFERRKVNDEVWLPAREVFHGAGRALLFRRFSVDTLTTYSDYRKFTVQTDEKVEER